MPMAEIPETGSVVLDTAQNRVGVVMFLRAGMVHLRPGGSGGEPWTARLDDVCPASPTDELRTRVAEANARRGLGR
jgi:hypothetical protein